MSGKHRFIALFLIVSAIFGVWWMKRSANGNSTALDDQSAFALHADDSIDLEQLKSYGLPIMLDFGADYCPPCRAMAPVLEELNAALKEKAIIKYVDIEKYPQLAESYPIRVIPTQVFFDQHGNPYLPSDPEALGMLLYRRADSAEHVLTAHEGALNKEQILAALREMGLDDD
jgi:thioredoxin 1